MVVEDYELLREGLVLMVERTGDFQVVAQAGSAEEALEVLDQARPDMILLDLVLPQMSGVEVCRQVMQRFPETRVVLLTGKEDLPSILEAVQAGACAYLPKDIGPGELVDSLRRIHQGGDLLEAFLGKRLLEALTGDSASSVDGLSALSAPSRPQPASALLSAREVQVLRGIQEGGSNRVVAEKLSISEFTVANHLKNIFRKLGVHDRTRAVLVAMDRGLLTSLPLLAWFGSSL
jgi:DNA-binding NarL/FixJ family response regulator